jgi:DMSO/TMAO reductase YedYZ molybdopterin-dependent catalytic subunit
MGIGVIRLYGLAARSENAQPVNIFFPGGMGAKAAKRVAGISISKRTPELMFGLCVRPA